jgi:homoserine kinase
MNITVKQLEDKSYMEVEPGEEVIASPQDALDLIVICGEEETCRILLHADNVSPAFFDLSTRLAGEVLLKFANYRLKVALVIPADMVVSDHFSEFASETRRSNDFRIFYTENSAAAWLVAD